MLLKIENIIEILVLIEVPIDNKQTDSISICQYLLHENLVIRL